MRSFGLSDFLKLPPKIKTGIFVAVCGILACLLSYQWSGFIAHFLHFEYLGINVRSTLLSEKPKTQSRDLTIVAIDEKELDDKPFVIPTDRGYLADVVLKLAAYHPKRIVIDMIYDRHTSLADDVRLQQTLKTVDVPVVLAYADTRTPDEDQSYQLNFLKKTGRPFGYANLLESIGEEQDDFEVTHIPQSIDGRCSLSDLAANPECLKGSSKPRPIDWLLLPQDGHPNFATLRPRDIAVLSASDSSKLKGDSCDHQERKPIALSDFVASQNAPFLHCRIILLGAMLSYQDTHKTPVSSFGDFTGEAHLPRPGEADAAPASTREIPGLIIQAFATQQLLDNRHINDISMPVTFLLVLIAGLLGALIMTLPIVEEFPRFFIFIGSLAFIVIDIGVEGTFKVLFPGDLVVVAFALGVFAHLARYRWRHEEAEALKEEDSHAFSAQPFIKAFFRLVMEIFG